MNPFYVNKFLVARLIEGRVNSTFESMFAVGVDEMSWDDLDEKHYDWPAVAEVQAYRDRVRGVVDVPPELACIHDEPGPLHGCHQLVQLVEILKCIRNTRAGKAERPKDPTRLEPRSPFFEEWRRTGKRIEDWNQPAGIVHHP